MVILEEKTPFRLYNFYQFSTFETYLKYFKVIKNTVDNEKYKYFTSRFKRVITRSVSIISEQMRRGEFEIFSNEYTFGSYKEGAPIKLTLPDKEEVYLTGRIDRIDKLEMDGMVDGLRTRSHRIRALGNAVVPIQAKAAFEELMGLRKHDRVVR